MVAQSGRQLRFSRDGTPIVGATADTVTIEADALDATDKDDAGWRTLIADIGQRRLSGNITGVMKNDTLIAISTGAASALMEECDLEITGMALVTGDFMLTSLEKTAEHAGVVEFTAAFSSSGVTVNAFAPYFTVLPSITGTIDEGDVLTCVDGTIVGQTSIARQWQRSIDGGFNWTALGTGTTYTLVAGDVGHLVRVRVTGNNATGSHAEFSAPVGPITT